MGERGHTSELKSPGEAGLAGRGGWNSQRREQHMRRPEVLRWQSSVGGNMVTVRVLSMFWWLSWYGGWDLE